MQKIIYRSTNRKSRLVTFKEALLKGQAPDCGLYVPTKIPRLTKEEHEFILNKKYHEIAFTVLNKFLHDEIGENDLKKITKEAYNFDVPLEKINYNSFLMRLDRGPTASFKDFAARLMARLMHYFASKDDMRLTVLTATSGDTGGAVADAFHGLKGISVIVLFPEKEVYELQRKQMTTLGGNVRAFGVKGNFDDCQAMVKQAFNDKELDKISLTSANSINFGRLLPQAVYYFYAHSMLSGKNAVFSVPSGNFGNLMGGVIAREMGLNVERFIAAVNENDEFPSFLKTGSYRPVQPSRKCSSSAMNVGHPSNLARLVDLYGGWLCDERDRNGKIVKKGVLKKKPDMKKLNRDFASFSITNKDTDKTIKDFYSKYEKLLEPHGAVAWCALEKYSKIQKFNAAVSLETADPAKFPSEITRLLGIKPKIPKSLIGLDKKKEKFEVIKNYYKHLKSRLISLKT